MPRLSKLLEKLEDRLADRWGRWYERHKAKLPIYIPVGLVGWYIYGMFLNSIRLGTASTFQTSPEPVESIWVFNPFLNLLVVLSACRCICSPATASEPCSFKSWPCRTTGHG